jgi:hypothetical protein
MLYVKDSSLLRLVVLSTFCITVDIIYRRADEFLDSRSPSTIAISAKSAQLFARSLALRAGSFCLARNGRFLPIPRHG